MWLVVVFGHSDTSLVASNNDDGVGRILGHDDGMLVMFILEGKKEEVEEKQRNKQKIYWQNYPLIIYHVYCAYKIP